MESWAPVVRFVPEHVAHLQAGRLRADGLQAKVVRQPQSFYAYGQLDVYMILVPEPDAARAVWVLQACCPDEGP